ncbi:MAG TPA: hypothetical protein VKB56_05175 [Terriglobales bacterium]|nr:hypothetical protein [Terriglobales bacterium]
MESDHAVNRIEGIELAEAKMNSARERLLSYLENRGKINGDEYRRLAARVRRAEADFMKAMGLAGVR